MHMDDVAIISFRVMCSLFSVSVRLWNDPGQIMSFSNNPWTSQIIVGAEVKTRSDTLKCLNLSGRYRLSKKGSRVPDDLENACPF